MDDMELLNCPMCGSMPMKYTSPLGAIGCEQNGCVFGKTPEDWNRLSLEAMAGKLSKKYQGFGVTKHENTGKLYWTFVDYETRIVHSAMRYGAENPLLDTWEEVIKDAYKRLEKAHE